MQHGRRWNPGGCDVGAEASLSRGWDEEPGPDDRNALAAGTGWRKINGVLDAQVSKCLDRIGRGRLTELLEMRIRDRRPLRLIVKRLVPMPAARRSDGRWTLV